MRFINFAGMSMCGTACDREKDKCWLIIYLPGFGVIGMNARGTGNSYDGKSMKLNDNFVTFPHRWIFDIIQAR